MFDMDTQRRMEEEIQKKNVLVSALGPIKNAGSLLKFWKTTPTLKETPVLLAA